jgi:hypothetical protein
LKFHALAGIAVLQRQRPPVRPVLSDFLSRNSPPPAARRRNSNLRRLLRFTLANRREITIIVMIQKKLKKKKNSVVQYLYWTPHLKTMRLNIMKKKMGPMIMISNAALLLYRVRAILYYSFEITLMHPELLIFDKVDPVPERCSYCRFTEFAPTLSDFHNVDIELFNESYDVLNKQ